MNRCTCHERDSSYTCPACHEEGCFGHMEKELEIDYLKDKVQILEDLIQEAKYIVDNDDGGFMDWVEECWCFVSKVAELNND